MERSSENHSATIKIPGHLKGGVPVVNNASRIAAVGINAERLSAEERRPAGVKIRVRHDAI